MQNAGCDTKRQVLSDSLEGLLRRGSRCERGPLAVGRAANRHVERQAGIARMIWLTLTSKACSPERIRSAY